VIAEHLLLISTAILKPKVRNEIAEKWKQKVTNWSGIMDTGCTLCAGAKKDMDCFHDTGLPFKKVFMLPDTSTIKATKKMQLKHGLRAGAGKMNIVPNLHSTLISVPKMADHGYIAVFDKTEARIYNGTTTTITTLGEPLIVAPRCNATGLWKMELDLDYVILGQEHPNHFIVGVNAANAIFNLPNTRQSLMYYHALAGFPVKETFMDAVLTRNYATWPGLTTTLISKHFPDSKEMQKGHMKGQRKGVRLTRVKAATTIKIKPGMEESPPKLVAIKRMNDIFVKIYELVETSHTDQMGTFPITSQQGYRFIMVGIHLDANYIFCELMKNRMEGTMITAYQKIVDRMKIARLGLKHHRLDNECSEIFKKCIQKNGMTHKLVPPDCHCWNMAKCAIQTFKNHFVLILSGVNDRFPLSLWCHLVGPAKSTVNLL
jgi:hypothetical protein